MYKGRDQMVVQLVDVLVLLLVARTHAAQIIIESGGAINLGVGSAEAGDAKIQPRNLTLVNATVSNQLRVGNRILDLWSEDLPVPKMLASIDGDPLGRCTKENGVWQYKRSDGSFGKCGYAAGALHMQTSLPCSTEAAAEYADVVSYMWHFKLTGHNFHGREWYECHGVGYMQSLSAGISSHSSAECLGSSATRQGGNVQLSQYCGPSSGLLVLKLDDSDPPERWHASDLLIDFICGKSNYCQTAANAVSVLDAQHNDADQVY